MEKFKVGETVQGIGINSGAWYEGVVVGQPVMVNAGSKIRITKVLDNNGGSGQKVGSEANIKNVKRSNEMAYVKNLVGPRPEPVEEPKFVAPFRSDGRNVVDANLKVVFRIQFGGYLTNQYRSELPMAEAYELARLAAEALTEKFAAPVEDSKSPF